MRGPDAGAMSGVSRCGLDWPHHRAHAYHLSVAHHQRDRNDPSRGARVQGAHRFASTPFSVCAFCFVFLVFFFSWRNIELSTNSVALPASCLGGWLMDSVLSHSVSSNPALMLLRDILCECALDSMALLWCVSECV